MKTSIDDKIALLVRQTFLNPFRAVLCHAFFTEMRKICDLVEFIIVRDHLGTDHLIMGK